MADANSQTQKVLQVARRLAATIGSDFFQAIAKHLARAISADCVLIGEFAGGQMERVHTLGAWLDGEPANFEFELAESAAAGLAYGKSFQYRSDARSRFPSDALLAEVDAHAVLGVPLLDRQGRPIGAMMALYRRPIVHVQVARQLLQVFSGRAAAELSRKRHEDELRESEQRYRAFIAKSADAMWRVEFERPIDTGLDARQQLADMYRYGYLAECNDALAALLGLEKAEQLIGARLEDVTPRSDPQYELANLDSIRSGYDFTTVEITRMDGQGRRRHLLRSQWGIVEDDKLARVWGVSRDITDLKLSTEELGASERRMSRLLETMKLVVVIENPAGAITYCNKYFYQITGWTAGAVTGKTWAGLLSPSEERERLLGIFEAAASKPETPVHFESTLLGPGSERWHFDWDRTVLRDAKGDIAAWANVGRDVTSQKALEAQLRQAQKLATIGRVAGGVAHDFNNLLTVILGYSSRLLETRNTLDPKTLTTLEEIQKAASKGADLTHRLLAFGRRQILKPEVLSLNSLVTESAQMLRTLVGEHIQLTTALEPALWLVRIDAGSFNQVLMNLAVNARDAMPGGGDLTIATANVTVLEPQTENLVPAGDYVEVTVSDTGLGMTEEVCDHLFEPFFTTKSEGKGTGLGLSTVWGIVQQSGGNIAVKTACGHGTTFRIRFPRVEGDPNPDIAKEPGVAPRRGSETVLLVDDRKEVRDVAAAALHDLGYTVLVKDAAGALELALDRSRTIHLLLTDICMPRTNGFDLASKIRTCQGGIKVLYMSGYTDPAYVAENTTQPGSAYLQKPFTPRALAEAVRELLDRSQ